MNVRGSNGANIFEGELCECIVVARVLPYVCFLGRAFLRYLHLYCMVYYFRSATRTTHDMQENNHLHLQC